MFLSGGLSNSEIRGSDIYCVPITGSWGALLSVIKIKENEKTIYWDILYRWVIRLQSVDLTIFHIPSRDNFVSDLLKGWGEIQSHPSMNVARFSHLVDRSSNKPTDKVEL
eukprot:maker-scaffold_23-snap-gene-0.5-mRNA-1 protein AED:0.26 eAED:0.39 QI:0/0/0/1/0/0/3/0/109